MSRLLQAALRLSRAGFPKSFSAREEPSVLEPADLNDPVRPCEGVASCASLIRPSDRRGPGQDPRPQCAFEKSVLNVSCNSHQVSQLAAFFIDP